MLYEPTDQELVIRLKSGDLTALAAPDQRHRVRTVRLIAQLAKSYEEAEDIYQEAILKVVSHIDTFDHRRSFHSWLHRVAKNHCIDNYRRRKRVEVTGDDEILLRVAGDSRDPLDEPTDRELQGEFKKQLTHCRNVSNRLQSCVCWRDLDIKKSPNKSAATCKQLNPCSAWREKLCR